MNGKKYICFVLTVCLCMMIATGCSNPKRQQSIQKPESNLTITPDARTKINDGDTPETTEKPTSLNLDDLRELSIYSIDSQSAEKVSITALIDSGVELSPEIIVDKVTESMADEAFIIGVDCITTQGDTIIVSFRDDQPPVTNVGSSVESEILDAIAQSLLDNLEGYHKVIFHVMDGPYESGHIQMDIDDVYMEVK